MINTGHTSNSDTQDTESFYDALYGSALIDPEAETNPHYEIEAQIVDLIGALSVPDRWIDFSDSRHQVFAKFANSKDGGRRNQFLLQLLLAMELHLRIHLQSPTDRSRTLAALSAKVAWDVILARRWLENVSVGNLGNSGLNDSLATFKYQLHDKPRQKEALRAFSKTLKWPNHRRVEAVLSEEDQRQMPLEERSGDAWTWFSGVILPGLTLPWILMNTLIDCDPDTNDDLVMLTHMATSSGFQYRGCTYWSWQCIVGKVLGAGHNVSQVAGWIGPCQSSQDLNRSECARIHSDPALDIPIHATDVQCMAARSSPLGPIDDAYPVADYEVVAPDFDEMADEIRLQRLRLYPGLDRASSASSSRTSPITYEAAITFAVEEGLSYRLQLRYNVDFISAFPCHEGPHVLFYDYSYQAIKVGPDLRALHNWADENKPPRREVLQERTLTDRMPPAARHLNKILVIEALGVSDNELFARAWCANWGVSAIVADISQTCMACAIREAYAACVTVVIICTKSAISMD
jgi:hypothetical protein